ncbi:MAG TPA: efflux RND transporter periplasmic adaptor subunit [Puia sp.]
MAELTLMKNQLSSLFLLLGLVSCTAKLEKTSPQTGNITASVYAAGFVKARNQYQVYSTVSGIVDKIYVTENDRVKKGTPIMLIADQPSRLNRENSDLSAQYAALQTNEDKLTDLKNNIDLAGSKYQNDSLVAKRQENLWSQGIGSKLEMEQKDLAAQSSKIAMESAKIKYNDLLRQLKLNDRQSQNNLAISRSRENDYTIKSELAGRMYFIYPKRGEIISPQTVLAVIGDSSAFYLELEVDEYDIVKLKTGQEIIITMDSYRNEVFEARVTKIDPLMNDRTKTFRVEAEFTKRPPVLYPNLTVEANIVIQTKEKAITIPRNYLVNDSFVIVNKTEKRAVKTGIKDYQRVEIIQGLSDQDIIYKPKE